MRQIIKELMTELDFENDLEIIDPKADEQQDQLLEYAKAYWERRHRNGVTFFDAKRLMRERNYFASMMVNTGDADAMVSGYARSYPTVLRPVLETIGKYEGVQKVAATNLMLTSRGPLFISDTSACRVL